MGKQNESKNLIKKYFNILSKTFGIILVVLIGILILISINWGFLSSEISAYLMFCNSNVTRSMPGYINESLDHCLNYGFTGDKQTYKISISRQEVIAKESIHKSTKCSVIDRRNWSCEIENGSDEFGFRNGKYWEELPSEVSEITSKAFYVSRLQWLRFWAFGR